LKGKAMMNGAPGARRRRRVAGLVMLSLLLPVAAWSGTRADTETSLFTGDRQTGDQALSASVGLLVPLWFQEPGGDLHDTNLDLGGAARFQFDAYLGNSWRVGLAIDGAFASSPNGRTFYMVPLTLQATWALEVSRFSFPLSLGLGMNIVGYRDWSHVDLVATPAAGCYWRRDSNWEYGLRFSWWIDYQQATSDQDADQTRWGHFFSITPGLVYHVQ
jgi:hypothetical protein